MEGCSTFKILSEVLRLLDDVCLHFVYVYNIYWCQRIKAPRLLVSNETVYVKIKFEISHDFIIDFETESKIPYKWDQ